MGCGRVRAVKLAGVGLALCLGMVGLGVPTAVAEPPGPAAGFYTPPNPLPAGNDGDLIRTGPSNLALSLPLPNGPIPGTATRVMYRSQDANDQPNAVTGTYIDPSAPWTGPGPRPLVVIAPGTHGQGDQCAPSHQLNNVLTYQPILGLMVEYELVSTYALLSKGYGVMITDYDGLGTPGTHTYVNRAAEAHAVLDAARAALKLQGVKVGPDSPVGLWGYSQGGGAVAAAVELAPEYAPDLKVAGTYAGAPVADLAATLSQVDGTFLTGVIAYTVNGLERTNPELIPIIDASTNDNGKAVLAAAENQCIVESALTIGFHRTNEWIATGQSLSDYLKNIPEAQEVLAENRVGNRTPTSPVYVDTSTGDDIVPYGQAEQLSREWCGRGAKVTLNTQRLPFILPGLALSHVLPDFIGLTGGLNWLDARFRGQPTAGTCA
ncbi:lipase family protein [Rhodococcoides corynebacterioides]|uniref:lipase family protein n=1 Tax=Rhodococcoides corynebacterioides TaxID=53972 RepID=UPI003F7E4160